MVENVIPDRLIDRAATVAEEFGVLVIHCALGTGEDLLLAAVVPEIDEMRFHFVEQEAVVCGSGRVDDVVDAGFGDDEAVGEALAFGALARGCFRVLATVVGGEIADDIGVGRFAEDEVGVVVFFVFLWLSVMSRGK